MADEKKPKIDLKARLGKTAVAGTPPPGAVGTPMPGGPVPVPVPPPPASSSRPPPVGMGVPGIPIGQPAGGGGGGGALAAALAQAAAPPTSAPAPAAPPQPQRIEVDEMTVQQARKGAQKQWMIIGVVMAVAGVGVGFVAGGANATGEARSKSKADATEMAADVRKAKATLEGLSAKVEAGAVSLGKDRKFPETLGKELGAINVDFDGTKLAGRRFSGFSTDTTQNLFEFITQVQALKDRQRVLQGLLSRLQKPITEQFTASPGDLTVMHVLAVSKDKSGNPAGFLTTLATPIKGSTSKLDLPAELTFTDPGGQGNASAPAYKGGDISSKPGAIYVDPRSFNKVCPAETAGAAAQLAAQMRNIVRDIKGEQQAAEDLDKKPGLLERAETLAKQLDNVK